jgi:hypothetical protein
VGEALVNARIEEGALLVWKYTCPLWLYNAEMENGRRIMLDRGTPGIAVRRSSLATGTYASAFAVFVSNMNAYDMTTVGWALVE